MLSVEDKTDSNSVKGELYNNPPQATEKPGGDEEESRSGSYIPNFPAIDSLLGLYSDSFAVLLSLAEAQHYLEHLRSNIGMDSTPRFDRFLEWDNHILTSPKWVHVFSTVDRMTKDDPTKTQLQRFISDPKSSDISFLLDSNAICPWCIQNRARVRVYNLCDIASSVEFKSTYTDSDRSRLWDIHKALASDKNKTTVGGVFHLLQRAAEITKGLNLLNYWIRECFGYTYKKKDGTRNRTKSLAYVPLLQLALWENNLERAKDHAAHFIFCDSKYAMDHTLARQCLDRVLTLFGVRGPLIERWATNMNPRPPMAGDLVCLHIGLVQLLPPKMRNLARWSDKPLTDQTTFRLKCSCGEELPPRSWYDLKRGRVFSCGKCALPDGSGRTAGKGIYPKTISDKALQTMRERTQQAYEDKPKDSRIRSGKIPFRFHHFAQFRKALGLKFHADLHCSRIEDAQDSTAPYAPGEVFWEHKRKHLKRTAKGEVVREKSEAGKRTRFPVKPRPSGSCFDF